MSLVTCFSCHFILSYQQYKYIQAASELTLSTNANSKQVKELSEELAKTRADLAALTEGKNYINFLIVLFSKYIYSLFNILFLFMSSTQKAEADFKKTCKR